MTDAQRPFVNESVEAFRQARIREAAATRRDDGALVELARAIGEKCGVPAATPDVSEKSAALPDTGLAGQPSTIASPARNKPPAGPEKPVRRPEMPRFAPAYRKVSQRVRMDWQFARELEAVARAWPPSGPVVPLMPMRASAAVHGNRSLPGTPAFTGEGLDEFDIGQRFNVKWPEQRAIRRVNDYVKVAASVGVIAAAIAGFWGGSVIRSGHSEANASLNEPQETSALAAGRAIRVISADSVRPGSGSPFGSGPSAFGVNGQGTPGRPLQPAIAVVKPDLNEGSAASLDSSAAIAAPAQAVSPPALPMLPTIAPDTGKGTLELRPVPALGTSLPAATGLAPPSSSLAPASAPPSIGSAPAKPSEKPGDELSPASKMSGHGPMHGAQPVKKRNPLAIVRFNSRSVTGDRSGPRPPASVPRSVVAQHGNDFFLTRFLDKIFRN